MVSPAVRTFNSPFAESGVETRIDSVEDFMEAGAESGGRRPIRLIANRRAQLEDAETLRRMRAL